MADKFCFIKPSQPFYLVGKLVAEYSLTSATPTTATTQYLGTDMLGSPRVITDQNANVISRRDFMPFGEDLTRTNYGNDAIRQKFTGYQKDTETGLDFAEARYYNDTQGRFTAVDPLLASGKSANPQTFNRYAYTGNNPLAKTDPSGMQAGFWAYQDTKDQNGTVNRTFSHFKSQSDLELRQTIYGGDGWQKWTGGDFYIFGNRTGVRLPENGNGSMFRISDRVSDDALSGIISNQESGQPLSEEQSTSLGNEWTRNFYVNTPENAVNVAIAGAAGGLSEGIELGLSAGLRRLFSSNYVYRSITASQLESIQAGEGIFAKNPDGLWSLEDHLVRGSSKAANLNDPWISTTTDINIARSFSNGNGVIRINLNKLPITTPALRGAEIFPRSSEAFHFSFWQQEVTIFRHIPQNAIKVVK